MKGDYDLFFEYYYAIHDYVLADKVAVTEHTLHDFLHTQQYYRLSHEVQRFAKRFAEEDISVGRLLLNEQEAHEWYLFYYKQNFPAGYPFNHANLEFMEGEYELKDFSPIIGSLGHQPLHTGILRKRMNEDYFIFPYFKNQAKLSHLILRPIVNKLMTENKYNVRKSIELVQLFEAEAIGSGWERNRIKAQMEEVLRQQLHYRVSYSDIKKLWLQMIFISFRYEKDETSYIQWEHHVYADTVRKLENFAAVLDGNPDIQLTAEEGALLKWVRFVVFRSRGMHAKAKEEAHKLLEREELVLGASRQPLYTKLDIVPINDTYKDLVVRKLSIDFRDILVSYLLDSYIADRKYEAAFFLLQQSDPYFKQFIPRYYRSANRNKWMSGEGEVSTEQLFRQQVQRVRIVLGDHWVDALHKEIEEEMKEGVTLKKDAFDWLLRYLYNVMSIFHEMQEDELADQMNAFYAQMRLAE
jgi:hypothetical protein